MEQQDDGSGCAAMILICVLIAVLIIVFINTLDRISDLERRVGVLEQQVGTILKPKDGGN